MAALSAREHQTAVALPQGAMRVHQHQAAVADARKRLDQPLGWRKQHRGHGSAREGRQADPACRTTLARQARPTPRMELPACVNCLRSGRGTSVAHGSRGSAVEGKHGTALPGGLPGIDLRQLRFDRGQAGIAADISQPGGQRGR